MKILSKLKSTSTSKGIIRYGETVDLPDDEAMKLIKLRPYFFDVIDEPQPKQKRKSKK